MKSFELAFDLCISHKVNSMNDNLPWVDICHWIRYLAAWIGALIDDGYVEFLLEVSDVVLFDDALSFLGTIL